MTPASVRLDIEVNDGEASRLHRLSIHARDSPPKIIKQLSEVTGVPIACIPVDLTTEVSNAVYEAERLDAHIVSSNTGRSRVYATSRSSRENFSSAMVRRYEALENELERMRRQRCRELSMSRNSDATFSIRRQLEVDRSRRIQLLQDKVKKLEKQLYEKGVPRGATVVQAEQTGNNFFTGNSVTEKLKHMQNANADLRRQVRTLQARLSENEDRKIRSIAAKDEIKLIRNENSRLRKRVADLARKAQTRSTSGGKESFSVSAFTGKAKQTASSVSDFPSLHGGTDDVAKELEKVLQEWDEESRNLKLRIEELENENLELRARLKLN